MKGFLIVLAVACVVLSFSTAFANTEGAWVQTYNLNADGNPVDDHGRLIVFTPNQDKPIPDVKATFMAEVPLAKPQH
uniref:Uncharacterized protein n=1 Tax=Plectus sambesii TaxID=2011161 RepID=A0A914W310_9BILA